jgi:hypothetical protein
MAPFHPNRFINLQKSSDQHGSLLPEPVYQPEKNSDQHDSLRSLPPVPVYQLAKKQ